MCQKCVPGWKEQFSKLDKPQLIEEIVDMLLANQRLESDNEKLHTIGLILMERAGTKETLLNPREIATHYGAVQEGAKLSYTSPGDQGITVTVQPPPVKKEEHPVIRALRSIGLIPANAIAKVIGYTYNGGQHETSPLPEDGVDLPPGFILGRPYNETDH